MTLLLHLFKNVCKYIFSHDYTFTNPVVVKKELNKDVHIQSICMESRPTGLVWHLSHITGIMKEAEDSNTNEY